jgi:hypothetical protein
MGWSYQHVFLLALGWSYNTFFFLQWAGVTSTFFFLQWAGVTSIVFFTPTFPSWHQKLRGCSQHSIMILSAFHFAGKTKHPVLYETKEKGLLRPKDVSVESRQFCLCHLRQRRQPRRSLRLCFTWDTVTRPDTLISEYDGEALLYRSKNPDMKKSSISKRFDIIVRYRDLLRLDASILKS